MLYQQINNGWMNGWMDVALLSYREWTGRSVLEDCCDVFKMWNNILRL